MSSYALDNHHTTARDHHTNLANLFDPGTRRRIQHLPGWARTTRCLEIGAGGGSISHWLARQLPPGGEVVAVDLHPERIPAHPRLRPVAHDLGDPTPLGDVLGHGYHLILARMVLIHLPQRDRLIPQLAQLLAPGGTLLVEDWVPTPHPGIVMAPTSGDRRLWARYRAAVTTIFTAAGAENTWGARAWPVLHHAGLVNLNTQITAEYWPGGHPGMKLIATSAAQLTPQLLEHGLTRHDLTRIHQLTHDPAMVIHGYPMYSTAGTRPT